MKLRKAVIPVAGLGTRFLPATKTVPKELLPIVDIPSIQYVVQEAVDAGIQEIIFVTGRGKDSIEDHFDEAPELEQVLAERGQTELVEMPPTVLGVVSVRGELITVYDPTPLLIPGATNGPAGAALLFTHGNRRIAVAVDDVMDAVSIDDGMLRATNGLDAGDRLVRVLVLNTYYGWEIGRA